LLVATLPILLWSSIEPYTRGTWLLEVGPAILTRKILLRRSPLRPGRWLYFPVACVCLVFSVFDELNEWFVARPISLLSIVLHTSCTLMPTSNRSESRPR
jgi:uncharacterized membrane protein YjdF